jgi:hypothetical protein
MVTLQSICLFSSVPNLLPQQRRRWSQEGKRNDCATIKRILCLKGDRLTVSFWSLWCDGYLIALSRCAMIVNACQYYSAFGLQDIPLCQCPWMLLWAFQLPTDSLLKVSVDRYEPVCLGEWELPLRESFEYFPRVIHVVDAKCCVHESSSAFKDRLFAESGFQGQADHCLRITLSFILFMSIIYISSLYHSQEILRNQWCSTEFKMSQWDAIADWL